ncbi:MAG: hypothetical protein KFF73_17060 [Cyclobacteriaceae bacterium]|nr:hypothetical protein [Cyclobacteriaceae bacterium]
MIAYIKKWVVISLLATFVILGRITTSQAQHQQADSLLEATLAMDSLLLAELALDSLTILDLIDSLIAADFRYSSLVIRAGYISDIINAGRDFGVNQYGLSGGLSYYHKSGLFGDITGYWNSDLEPNYGPTILSLGYMGNILHRWNLISSYEHNFYQIGENDADAYFPLTESLNLTTYYDLDFISFGFDYTFLFGEENAHRLRPHVFSTIRFPDVGFIDEISLIPSASVLFGNQNIYYLNGNYWKLRYLIRRYGLQTVLRKYRNNPELIESLLPEEEFNNVFGLMNYSFSLPVNFKFSNLSISTGYFLNIPVALPGETIDETPNHFFNVMALYFIPFRKR